MAFYIRWQENMQFKGYIIDRYTIKEFIFLPAVNQCISKADKNDVVCSENILYFFTSDEYDLYFFTVANRGCFDNLGLKFSPKRSGIPHFCLT